MPPHLAIDRDVVRKDRSIREDVCLFFFLVVCVVTSYREEVRDLTVWFQDNNLWLNMAKIKEMIVDYSKRRAEHAPILIDWAVVEQVESFKFLGAHITNKLSWTKYTKTVVKRARQCLFPLRRLKRFGMGPQILKNVYSCTIESILVASPTGMATTRHPTARRYRW